MKHEPADPRAAARLLGRRGGLKTSAAKTAANTRKSRQYWAAQRRKKSG